MNILEWTLTEEYFTMKIHLDEGSEFPAVGSKVIINEDYVFKIIEINHLGDLTIRHSLKGSRLVSRDYQSIGYWILLINSYELRND